ncbi:hypothetical protein PVT68_11695 [Microbulbifer bruguierae]|uniref:Lipoprotein n=1 Tax=Microbulbifer bruguierae TaxID=3029061 RepID=A0ABY8N966_9GAMM|nr:hypothetical protein [Microbulbifer bruguierae]WGL15431.1 hypothetical protein PVT68_11695 [Microbulbifer bruguierae]
MVRFKLGLFLVIFLQGCTSTEVSRITNGAVDGALREVVGNVSATGVSGNSASSGTQQSHVNKERVWVARPIRSSRDYGKIVTLENRKNSRSQTKLVLDSCISARIGPIDCTVYVYEVAADGRLVAKGHSIRNQGGTGIVIASGTYYVKAVNNISREDYATTGTLKVEPFVSNFVRLELE